MDSKHTPTWGWAIVLLLGLLIWQLVMNTSAIVAIAASSAGILDQIKVWLPAIAAVAALVIAVVLFHLLYLWPDRGIRAIGVTSERFRDDLLLGATVGVAQAAISLFVIIPALGDRANDVLSSVSGLFESRERLIASIVLVVVYGGIVEEIFFRGHIIHAVRNLLGNRGWSAAVAAIISVALFSFAHRYQGEIGIVYAAAASSIYAALYLFTNRLTASMSAHAIYDLVTLLGISVLYADKVAG